MSATTVARINTLVTANTTQFTAAMAKAQTRAGKFAAAAGAAAKAASGPLTMGLLAVGGAAVKAATDFDDSMTKIESLVGIAGAEVDAMKESVRDLSGRTAQAPAQLADAMFFIQSAGLRGATAMETLEASARAAAVGLGDVTEIADLATSALNAYGAENLSAVDATDVLTAAVREGKLEASELAGSMGRVLPIASAMGVRFDEVGAAFAALSRTGTNAAEAATQVRGILSSLLRPTKQAEEALTGMGLSSEGLRRQIQDEGLLATLQTLAEEFDGNAAASASVFGNIRALSGVMDLMGENVATTEAIFASMTDTTGTLDDAFAVVSDTAGFKFRQALADIQEALVGIGERALPIVLTMLEGAREMAGAFAALPRPVKLAAAAVAAFVVASGPIGRIAIAVGGLLTLFAKAGEEAKRTAELQATLTDEFVKAGDPTIHLADRIRDLAGAIESVGEEAGQTAPQIDGIIGEATVFSRLLERDMLPVLNALGMDLERFTEILQDGADEFDATGGMADQLTKMLFAQRDVYPDLYRETEDVVQIARELAEAFDSVTAEAEANNQAVINSGEAFQALEAAGLDAQQMLGDFEEQGLSATDQLLLIEEAIDLATQRAGAFESGFHEMRSAMMQAEGPIEDVADAFEDAAEETKSFEDAFRDLVATITGPGDALNDAQLLIEDVNDVIAELADRTLPEARDEFSTFAQDAAANLGALVDQGMELGGPELLFHVNVFLDKLGEINEAAKRPVSEFLDVLHLFEQIAGVRIDVPVRLNMIASQMGLGDADTPFTGADLASQIGQIDFGAFAGATGGIVTRPTRALIGEAGPEAVVPLSSAPGASPLPAGGLGGGTVNVTVNMPPGANGNDVVRALQQYARAHGGKVPIVTGQL